MLLAEWLSVSHVDLPPRRKKEEEGETPAAQPAPVMALAAAAQGSAMPVLNGHGAEVDGETPTVVEPRVNGTSGVMVG